MGSKPSRSTKLSRSTELSRNIVGSARDDVEITHEVLGPPSGEPILLIMGMGSQLIEWPDEFCADLVGRGFTVARFDNRDVGLSTHFTSYGVPNPVRLLLSAESVAAYRIGDMAADGIGVMDRIGWNSAHVVGVSMGGIVAAALAVARPDRVRSLTAISSTPWWRIGRQPLSTTIRAAIAYRRPMTSREQAGQRAVEMGRILASPGYPFEEALVRELGRRSYDRDRDVDGVQRQNAAVLAARDLRGPLSRLRLPTLVLHGDADVMIRPAGGAAFADAVPGARLVVYPGMGHDLPRPLWTPIAAEIARVAGD